MEREAITLPKLTIDQLVELGADHDSMVTPTSSIYEIDPLATQLGTRIKEKLSDGTIQDRKRLLRVLPRIANEVIQNAIEHGNELDPSKQIHAYFLWQEHGSGNALMYIAVQDEGKGFDVNRYRLKNPKHGGEALPWAREMFDHIYNFGDPAVYMAQVIRRDGAKPIVVEKGS
ncbi:hypothetical protein CMO93_00620 [Candidatus Woesearchaeota archaeon]|nr:hypothetical protein [Candidatus Woesearchaeota archaeon]|tara:strand:- start:24118 stop:24636 length:519 start_codon:yes stop_codon:yes gene_type:complete